MVYLVKCIQIYLRIDFRFERNNRYMHRFFVHPAQISESSVRICGDDVKHISGVLRLGIGDTICVCDGACHDFECRITEISKSEITAEITGKSDNINESGINVTLYQGIPKGDKMDFIVQKCVELGVVKIVPVNMKRCIAKSKNISSRLARWQRIALEAAKQCQRGIVPEICEPVDFDSMVNMISHESALNIMPYECEDKTGFKHALQTADNVKDINIIIGPEGGFDDSEAKSAREAEIHTVTLGARILRCETAPIATVAAVMYEFGNM